MMQCSEFEDAIVGLVYRIAACLKSLIKMNHPIDIQAVFAAARTILELTLDVKLLVKDPSLGPQFHAFVFVERFRAAKAVVDFVDSKFAGDRSKAKAERTFICDSARQQKLEHLCRQFGWSDSGKNRPKRVNHWSGLDLYARAERVGIQYQELYRVYYPLFSWNVHAGAVGVSGISAKGIESGFGVAHTVIQDLVYDATEDVCIAFRWFDADPDLREKLRVAKEAFPRSLFDLSIKALEEENEGDEEAGETAKGV